MIVEQRKSIVAFFEHRNFEETAEVRERLTIQLHIYDNSPVDFYLGGYGKYILY